MKDLRAIRRYALALFGLAHQQGVLDKTDDELHALRQMVENHPEIMHLVSNSTIALAEKEDFIGKIVPPATLPLLVNFLKVLVKKKRFTELKLIQEEFHRIYEKNRRVEEVTAISAIPLSPANAQKLEKVLEQKLKSDIRLIFKTDDKMIGGLILRFGGHEINASFRSRLDALHQALVA